MPQRFNRWHQLSADECLRLLTQHHLGRIAVIDDDGPMILPVTYVVDGESVLFRTDQAGTLQAAAYGADQVALEVDVIDECNRTGWSGLVRGAAEQDPESAEVDRLRPRQRDPGRASAATYHCRARL